LRSSDLPILQALAAGTAGKAFPEPLAVATRDGYRIVVVTAGMERTGRDKLITSWHQFNANGSQVLR
jgi:hypothetical protein